MLHHIQKAVIDALAKKDPARYADLKPTDMDGNQFTYHLKQLISDKMVQKNNDSSYSLTQKGRTYLVRRFENDSESAHSIFLVVIRHDDKVLMRERKVQPLNGYVGFVHGEPKANEPLVETIRNRINLKTGIILSDTDDIMIHGSGLIRIVKDGQVQSFSHAIIVEVAVENDDLPILEDATGKNFWIEHDKLDNEMGLPSNMDIMSYIKDPSSSWFDWTYEV